MTRVRRTSMLCLVTACGLSAAGSMSVVRAGDVDGLFEQVPAEASGFVVIPNLQKLNDSVNAVQIAVMGMAFVDPMSMLTAQLGIEKGLDKKGGVIVFALDHKKYPGKPIAAVVTVTNADEFLANFAPEDDSASKDGDSNKSDSDEKKAAKPKLKPDADGLITCDMSGQPVYAHVKGNYVTLAADKAVAKAAATMTKNISGSITGARKKLFAQRAVSVSIAASRVVAANQEDITQALPGILAMMGPQAAGAGNSIEEVLQMARQLDSFDLAIDLGKDGFSLTTLLVPKTGTELEEEMKAAPTSSGSLLKGLPGPDYIVAFGACGPGKSKGKDQIQKAIDNALKSPKLKEDLDPEKLKKFASDAQSLQGLMTKVAGSISALAEGPSGILALSVVVESPDSAKLLETIGTLVAAAKQLPAKEEDRKKFEQVLTHQVAAETIGSAKVDHLSIDLAKTGVDDEEAINKMKKVLGADGLTLRMGASDGKHLVLCLGGGKDRFSAVAKAVQSGDAALGSEPGIAKASALLPHGRRFEGFFSADGALKIANRIARAVGEDEPLPADLKPITVPVSAVASIDGATLRFDLVVPMAVVTGIKSAIMEGHEGSGHKAKSHKAQSADDKSEGKHEQKKPADNDEGEEAPKKPHE